MRVCDLSTGPARLHEALDTLRVRWQATAELWTDAVSQQFEQDHLAPLHPQLTFTIDRMRRLAQMLSKAQEECT